MKHLMTTLTKTAAFAALTLLGSLGTPVLAQTQTIDFDTLKTPPADMVGPAQRVYQEKGPGTFTLIRIQDPNDASTNGNHFHTTIGNGSAGNSNTTAAEFFSDDGQPFLYFDGNYTGTNVNNYAPDFSTAKTFSLNSFDILSLSGSFQFTSSTGNTLDIDHAGIYDLTNTPALTGFENILSFRHDYTGTDDGYMVLDNLKIMPTPAAVPEASSVVGFGLLVMLGLGSLAVSARRKSANPS